MDYGSQERVRQSQGKIARVRNKLLHFAIVEITVCWPAQEFSVGFDSHGEGLAEVYDDWKQGALAGIRYALTICHISPCRITITSIVGTLVDTNPTVVGGAAIQAVWVAAEYEPSTAEKAFVEQQVFQSWTDAPDSIPDFGV